MPEIIVYRTPDVAYVPIVSFNVRGVPSEVVADALRQEGLCLRAGLHCAPLAHQTLGTDATGTVRFAPSVFNTPQEVTKLLLCLHKCVRNLKTT
jgi:selenocysteine lyase/cysteine desulfurase